VARKPQEPGGASSGGGASRENCGRQRRPTTSQGLLAGRAYHRLDWGVWHDRRVSRRKRRPVRHRPPLNHSTVGVEPEEPAGSDFLGFLSCYGATPDPELELVVASHCHLTRFRGLRTAARVGRVAVRAQSAATRFEANVAERTRMRLGMRLQLAARALSRPSCQKDDTQTGRATAQTLIS
jgi:hypothetical protein